MPARQRVAVREHCQATDAAARGKQRTVKFSCRGRTIARTGRPENAPPMERCLLFFGAEAAVRVEIPPAGSTGPVEIVSLERNEEGSHSLRKSRAHPRGKYPNFQDAGLCHPAGNAAALPAYSTSARRLRRETMCRREQRGFCPGATAPRR